MRELACRAAAGRIGAAARAQNAVHAQAAAHAQEATWVDANLRDSLIRLAGVDGFAALLRRSVALASAELPAMRGAAPGAYPDEAAMVVTAHMLELLVGLIGEPLTRRLVHQAYPGATPEE